MSGDANITDGIVRLEAVMGLSQAGALTKALLERRGSDIILDAEQIEHLGGQCLQVLLSAQQTWRADDNSFAVINPSTAFTESMTRFGFSEDTFLLGEND